MKTGWFFLLCFLLNATVAFAIDDSSFKNKDKYQFLKIPSISSSKEFEVNATFYPPEGKKLNKASYIKIWEKKNKTWSVSEVLNPEYDLGIMPEYKLDKKVSLDSIKAPVAIEVEFIHCSLSGGQCAMERYLGKVERSKSSSRKNINLTLRIE
jgi:hypothetical protein